MTTNPDSGCSKIINYKGMNVQVINYGKSVQLVKGNQEFKVILHESDVSEENQQYIQIKSEDVVLEAQYQLKYECDQNKKTKVLFFKDKQGIAIRWNSGLQSKFTFAIDE